MPREAWVLVKAVVSDTYPDNALPGPQPPFPQPPQHPIAGWPGGLPGGGGFPGQGGPVDPGYNPPGVGGPGSGLGTWGGGNVPYPTPPIYIPIMPPPDSGLEPTHPIYIPVQPPLGIWGPTDPRPTLPIAGWNPGTGTWPQPPGGTQPPITPEQIEKLKKVVSFLFGNLPTDPTPKPEPV